MRRHLPAALTLFAVAFFVRWWLLCGLILGDDPQEFGALQEVLASGPDFRDQLQVRFGGWVANYVVAVLFGISETTVLLPTWLLSSSFGVLGYALLVRWGYGRGRAFAGGLLIATAPFEIVLGTLRTNDLYLGGALAVGFVLLVVLEERPVWQGIGIALALWFGFYVKLWAVYALPSLGIYLLAGRRWRTAAAFTATSVLVHGATLVFWKGHTGSYLPFVASHAANYAVAAKELLIEWARYPYMIFVGSYEFRTTLFGVTPWVLAVLLAVRAARRRLDRPDRLLLGFWGIFLLLLEFFPNGFTLDAYYTVPRIFRYLAPISFPVALHAAKLVLDVTRTWRPMRAVLVVVPLLGVQLLGGVDATLPGRIHRDLLFRVVRSIERLAPPAVVAESTLGYWLDSLYLDRAAVETRVVTPPEIYVPAECERWIAASAPTWPTGTVLVTGLGNYVHYGAHAQGLRLAWFDAPLDDRWTLVDDVGVASYLPRPETARLWRLERGATDAPPPRERDDPPPPDALDPAARLTVAIERFNAGDQRVARSHLRVLMNTPGPQTADARFFHAASYFRESAWPQAAHEFKQLLHHDPSGRWAAAAHWHLAICDLRLGHVRRARARFEYLLRRFPADHATTENARAELQRLMRRDGGLVGALWRRFTAPAR